MTDTKELKIGTAYRVTESFTTPVLDGHEIGGGWSEHSSVGLDPGEEFTVVGEGSNDSWLTAEMNHALRFNVGTVAEITWKGRFYVSESLHGDKIEEVK